MIVKFLEWRHFEKFENSKLLFIKFLYLEINTLKLSSQKKLQLHTLKKDYLATKLKQWKEMGFAFYIPSEKHYIASVLKLL